MKRVDIYICINPASTRKSKKRYGFILECVIDEVPHTKDQFGEVEDTYTMKVDLFGFIPFIKIEQSYNSICFILFDKLPLIKIQNSKLYLFAVILLFKLRG